MHDFFEHLEKKTFTFETEKKKKSNQIGCFQIFEKKAQESKTSPSIDALNWIAMSLMRRNKEDSKKLNMNTK